MNRATLSPHRPALNQRTIPQSVPVAARQQVFEYDTLLDTASALAHDRTTAPRRGGEQRAGFTAGVSSGRQVHVIDQPCVEQVARKGSAADA